MTLHQQWEIKEGTGIITTSKGVQLLSGKARFLPPRQWERWYLPWKLEVEGGVTVASCFQRPEVVSGALLTTGGMLRLDVYNASDKVIRITPKTPLVSLHGHEKLEVVRMARVSAAGVEVTAAALRQELAERFPAVSDLSTHPVLPNGTTESAGRRGVVVAATGTGSEDELPDRGRGLQTQGG